MIENKPSPGKYLNPWHFVWVAVVMAELFTALMNTIQQHFDPRMDLNYLLKVGSIDALFVSLIVAPIVIYFLRSESALKKMNAQLEYEIAGRKRTEEVLREGGEQYRQLFGSIRDAIVITDNERKIIDCNPAFVALFGYPRDEIVGKSTSSIFANHEQFTELGKQVRTYSGNKPFLRLIDYKKKSGEMFPGEAAISFFINNKGEQTGLIGLIKDITERKQAEKEKQVLIEEKQKSQKLESIGMLAGGIAHDFNNLLQSIIGNVNVAKMTVQPEHPLYKLLSSVEKFCLEASELSNRLLTFSPGGTPITKILSLSLILTNSVRDILNESTVIPVFKLSDDLYPVKIDKRQIEQVFKNLTKNAIEAMPTGGSLTVRGENIRISAQDGVLLSEGDYVKVSFSDTGAGIASDNLDKIFDAYYSTKDIFYQKGLGLGLAVCYSVIKKHNGLITADSEVGKGTTFNVYLPAAI